MPANDPNAHQASIEVAVPAETAFEFMGDGMKQNHWALGSVNRKPLGDNLFVGQSSFDGSDLYVKLKSDPEWLIVDYLIGESPETVQPAVEARIRRGESLGRSDSASVITLTLWRWPFADQDEWEMHYHLWKTEMHMIKGAIERGL